jgi:Chaperone of endosialidase
MPTFESSDPNSPAVDGEHTANGTAIVGNSFRGVGIHGVNDAPQGSSIKPTFGCGVFGESTNGFGIFGSSDNNEGIKGESKNQAGVRGESTDKPGVIGVSAAGVGVHGVSSSVKGGIGETGVGVLGEGASTGVAGRGAVVGVDAESSSGTALIATTHGTQTALVVNQRGNGNIIIGRNVDNAEVFRVTNSGDVQVRGITLTSDKNAKTNFSHINTRQILENLVSIPIKKWSYKTDPTNSQHIGPTSQDFQGAFGLNSVDDLQISVIDAQGIALAAIQGLNEKLNQENAQLRAMLNSLEERIMQIESLQEKC